MALRRLARDAAIWLSYWACAATRSAGRRPRLASRVSRLASRVSRLASRISHLTARIAPSASAAHPLLHDITLALHACAVCVPIAVHRRLLRRLRGLRLGGVLLTAAHAAGQCPRGRSDRRPMSRVVTAYTADDRTCSRASRRTSYARTVRARWWRGRLRNDGRIDAGALLRPGIAHAVVRHLLLLVLSMRGISCRFLRESECSRACQNHCGK